MLKYFELSEILGCCLCRDNPKKKFKENSYNNNKKKQLFFSHTWKKDELNRDNHNRVLNISKEMNNLGWSTWIDENDMSQNIDFSMSRGISNSEAVILCLTKEYFLKIDNAVINNNYSDNCFKEWNYSIIKNKLIIPIIMEPKLDNCQFWPGSIITMYLGNILFINGSLENFKSIAKDLHNRLIKEGLTPDLITQDNYYEKRIINNLNHGLDLNKNSDLRELYIKSKYINLIKQNKQSKEITFNL